ncbi:tripartite motif-containing protein 14-like [Engraulis encrasicolus]|uniref:tripartite motif-containing protein 14-like n=1 Tax=Engraulis encrasicolus TaxID=184585 RepID=UPI002FD4CFF5
MAQSIEMCLPKDQLKKRLTCLVCKDIFKDPYQLPCPTLNKYTANPFLHVSDDLLTVRRLKNPQYYPPHPLRFTEDPQVLSTQCASHGRHYWELEAEGSWDIAVTYETITTTLSAFGTDAQSWSLRHDSKGRLFAYHTGERQRIHKSLTHNTIGVVVDFYEGEIIFKEMGTTYNHLHTFEVDLNQPVCLGLGLFRPDLNTTISVKKNYSG